MAELKTYPKKEFRSTALTTTVHCAVCGQENQLHETLMTADDVTFYHRRCYSGEDTQQPAETKVVEISLSDDLGVKSEGR